MVPFTIPFPIKANSWALTTAMVFFIFYAIKQRSIKADFFRNPLFVCMTGLFAVLVLGLSYTSDMRQGLSELEKNLCLLVFPFLVFQWRKIGIGGTRLLWAFTAGCVLITLYGFIRVCMVSDAEERNYILSLGHSYYSSFIDLHPTYLSIYFIIIIFFLVDLLVRQVVSGPVLLAVIGLIIYSVLLIVFLRSRIAIPLLLVGAGIYLYAWYRHRWKQVLIVLAAAC